MENVTANGNQNNKQYLIYFIAVFALASEHIKGMRLVQEFELYEF